MAIKKGRLKTTMTTMGKRRVTLDDIAEYCNNKYSRVNSKYKGELTFDRSKGEFSVSQAAELLGVPKQKIYYAIRTGYLKSIRKGSSWVIHIDDIQEFKEKLIAKKRH